jgi:hypothetical protein
MVDLDERFRELAEAGARRASAPGPAVTRRRAARRRALPGTGACLTVVLVLAVAVAVHLTQPGPPRPAPVGTRPRPTASAPPVIEERPRGWGNVPPMYVDPSTSELDVESLDTWIRTGFGGRRTGPLTVVGDGREGALRWSMQAFLAERPDSGGWRPIVCTWLIIEGEEGSGQCADRARGISLMDASGRLDYEVYGGTVTRDAARVDAVMPKDRHHRAELMRPDGFGVGFWIVFVPAKYDPGRLGSWNRNNLVSVQAYRPGQGPGDAPVCQYGPYLYLVPAGAPDPITKETCPAPG